MERLAALAPYDIHSIEQPIRQGQWEALAKVCRESPIPVALDEELIGIHETEDKEKLLDTVRPHYVVLKPTLHGALTGAAEWMMLARERGIGSWITSALESNVGLNAIAQWCAAIDPDTAFPQGLGTGQLFVENYPMPLRIEGDCLWYGDEKQRNFRQEIRSLRHVGRTTSRRSPYTPRAVRAHRNPWKQKRCVCGTAHCAPWRLWDCKQATRHCSVCRSDTLPDK